MLEFHETDFLRAFKHQINLIAREMQRLKEKVFRILIRWMRIYSD